MNPSSPHTFPSLLWCLLLSATTLAQQPLFKLLDSKQTGIGFSNNINETENLNVLSYEYFYNGGGVAVGDINNDGLEDIFLTANMGPNRLYLNLGGMKFKDITNQAGEGLSGRPGGWKTGVTMADVNGDGLTDIYICYSGKGDNDVRRNQLFINQGNLKFKEQAAAYGLDDPGYSTQAAFFDYDNDGDLDMFLLNHNVKKIDNMEFARLRNETDTLAGDKLFENRNNHFVDISKKAGIRQNPLTFGLGVAIADVNKDGWQDIYVTNDYNEPDYLYINDQHGSFIEKSQQYFRHLSQFSMGVDIADFNNDGLPDIITLDMLPEDNRRRKLLQLQENYESFELMQSQDLYKQYMRNMLQLNNGDETFSEVAQLSGVAATDWSWCPLFADFDNDGYKDLLVTNGYLRDYTNKDFLRYWGDYKIKRAMNREPYQLMDLIKVMPSTTLPNYIFRNNHNLTFSNMQNEWGLERPGMSNGAVYADLDNDGDLDLVINKINEPAFVYQNTSREQFNTGYLSVKLTGKTGNINAVGAKVYLYERGGLQYQEVNPNRGYLSCVSTQLHFGLGTRKVIDSLRIIWPDNTSQLLVNVVPNQRLLVAYKEPGLPYAIPGNIITNTIFTKAEGIIDHKDTAAADNDFKRQQLMLFMYSKTSPVIAKGDINKDGLEDLYISGPGNKPGKLYVQLPGGKYMPGKEIGTLNSAPVCAAVFFDANGDGYDDLYLAKGGYAQYESNTAPLQDELYINDTRGNLILTKDQLPDLEAGSKSCVRACDYDGDGDIDLFVGGRIVPGKYPVTPKSYLLTNNGKGTFSVTAAPFTDLGMITDAQWVDLNNDGRKDLVLCGEFMPIKIYINTSKGFEDRTNEYFSSSQSGFWFTLTVADVDGDGKPDIIAGNLGTNSLIRASRKEPAELYYADFDGNGSIDPFFNYYIQGTSYPFVSRDELNEQIYPMRKKFTSYKDYSSATMTDIFSAPELAKAKKLTVNEQETVCFLNRNGKFVKAALPLQAQFSVVTKIIARDFNNDGNIDLLLLGNHSDNRLKMGSMDASYGCLLTGDGKGNFDYVSQPLSGLSIKGDVKAAEETIIGGNKFLVIGISNEQLQFFKEQQP